MNSGQTPPSNKQPSDEGRDNHRWFVRTTQAKPRWSHRGREHSDLAAPPRWAQAGRDPRESRAMVTASSKDRQYNHKGFGPRPSLARHVGIQAIRIPTRPGEGRENQRGISRPGPSAHAPFALDY